MIIAVPVSEDKAPWSIYERFGRAPFFAFFNTENSEIQCLINQNSDSGSGTGSAAVQILIDANADCLISPEPGPKAMQTLLELNIAVYLSGSNRNLHEAVKALGNKQLLPRIQHQSKGLYKA